MRGMSEQSPRARQQTAAAPGELWGAGLMAGASREAEGKGTVPEEPKVEMPRRRVRWVVSTAWESLQQYGFQSPRSSGPSFLPRPSPGHADGHLLTVLTTSVMACPSMQSHSSH